GNEKKRVPELSAPDKLQYEANINATNIILQGVPADVYALVSHHRVAKDLWERIELLMQGTSLTNLPLEWSKFMTDVQLVKDLHVTNFDQLFAHPEHHEAHANEICILKERSHDPLALIKGDDPINAINHMMSFLTTVVTSRYPTTNNQLRKSSNPRQQATINDEELPYNQFRGDKLLLLRCTKPKRKQDDSWFKDKVLLVQAQPNGQIPHEEELAFLADLGIPEVALIANLSHYGSDALTEVHNLDNVDNNMINQAVQNNNAIVISNSEKTLKLDEESHSKMLLKQKNSMNSLDPTPSNRPTKVEVPKELPKVSMVNTSLKKLKHHLAGFDVVVKTMEQHRLESKAVEIKMNQVLNEKERLLEQVINKYIVNIVVNLTVDYASVNVYECEKCIKLETELLNKKDFIEKEIYDKLFKSYTTLEKYCISLEVDTQLNQEIFQRENYVSNQSALSIDHYFELNKLKAQSQEKDIVISKLKERIKYLSGNKNTDKVKKDIKVIETINIELDHRVLKLIAKNEHLKQTYN
nr:hypothetical protein [Tanacetum cinerariifolium]